MRKWLTLFGLTALLSLASSAEPALELSLDQARQQAVVNHPTLAKLQARLNEMQHRVEEVEAGGRPHLEMQARYTYLTPQLGFATPSGSLPIVVNNNYQAGLVLEQALATFGRLHWGRQAAELQVRAVEQELVRERERLDYQVAMAYSRLQTARQSIEVAQLSLQARERLLKDLTAREKAGTSARFEILVADVARAQDQQRLVLAQQQSQLAQSQLQVLLGLPRTQSLQTLALPDRLHDSWPDPDVAVQSALSQRAELRAIDFAVNSAEAKVHFEESQSNPTFGLQTRYDQRTSTAFQTSNQWAAGVEFRWPLFDGGLAQARSAQAESARVQLSEGRRELERQVRLEVEEALVRCQSAVQNLEVSRRNQTSAAEAARLGELRFKAGVGTHQEVLDVQSRLREAQQGVFDAERGIQEAHWQLQLALGSPAPSPQPEPGKE
ncbi:TolC family protein [bacterium]|nr:TolC family protein [bacterium]